MNKKLIAFLSILSLFLSIPLIPVGAAVKPGANCKILGSKVVAGSFVYTCIKKNSKKYVWDKGVAVKKSSTDFQERMGNIELGVGNVRLEAAGCHEKGSATLQIQSSKGWKDLFPASGWLEDTSCITPQSYKPYFEGTLVGGSIVRWRTLNSSKLEWLSSPQTVTFGSDKTPKLLIIATDLPLQGGARDLSNSTNKAVELVLKQMANLNLIGNFVIGLRFYDNSTVAKGGWDDASCAKNAQAHAWRQQDEIAVLGAFNSGCTKIMVPILNSTPNGPMPIISHSASNPGLTKFWSIGEPEKYYPNKQRNFFRIATTDDSQGYASAKFALDLGVKSVFVLNDGTQPYGPGIARSFISAARELGLNVLSEGEAGQQFNPKSTNHSDLFTTIKSKNPDLVYVGGIFDGNQQLIKDKVKYLGDNTKVKLMLPDGFTGYPDFLALPEAQGAYLSFTGLSIDQFPKGGAAEKFQADYQAEYGQPPIGSSPVYGAAIAQVLLSAIANSDGSREDVLRKVKEVTIPAEKSVTGFEIKFDQNGDSVVQGVTLLQVLNKREVIIKSILR
jgi:branched-chain amino acid transport system substrate-binding protein